MLNDRDEDKYEGQPEESEYHFSEDDVSYEVETETPKPAQQSKEPKESLMSRVRGSKRMFVTGGIFLVLVFIVYKMVSPTSGTQTTDITPPSLAQQGSMPKPGATTTQAVSPTPATAPSMMATTQPSAVTTTTTTAAAPAPATQMPAPVAAQATPTDNTGPSMLTGLPENAMAASQNAPTAQTTTTTTSSATPQTDVTTGMPAVIPVQSNVAQTGTPAVTQEQAVPDSTLATIQANNEKLMNQMQAQYEQKLNESQLQNKALQSQVDTLMNKVSGLQSQMGDLVKALTRAQAASNAAPADNQNVIPGPASSSDRISYTGPYSVQAIIPGRAWLRSDAGDTVTVAEGDIIRGLGRVTKIDPYDGVVEINTGMKTLSLSYGNGN